MLEVEVREGSPNLLGREQQQHADVLLDFIRKRTQILPNQIVSIGFGNSREFRIDDTNARGNRVLPIDYDFGLRVVIFVSRKRFRYRAQNRINFSSNCRHKLESPLNPFYDRVRIPQEVFCIARRRLTRFVPQVRVPCVDK